MYWTTSEKRKENAEPETSEMRVLFMFLSYMLGLGPGGLTVARVEPTDGVTEKRVDVGERCSADESDEFESTENRGCGCGWAISKNSMSLQHHLYESFLAGSTTDVLLRVKFKSPQFKALYRLHRVVLIQSGFFRLLFTAGFSESSSRDVEPIDIAFDDPNISRAG